MSHQSKKQVTMDGPLSMTEETFVVGLLTRAVRYSQLGSIKKGLSESLMEKQYQVPARQFLDETEGSPEFGQGQMSEAAKRRLDPDDDTSSVMSGWSNVTIQDAAFESTPEANNRMMEKLAKSRGGTSLPIGKTGTYVISEPNKKATMKLITHINKNVKVPDNLTFSEWSRTICTMNKVKDMGVSYAELVNIAESDADIARYLKYIKTTYGSGGKGSDLHKTTPAMDLASSTFVRSFKP